MESSIGSRRARPSSVERDVLSNADQDKVTFSEVLMVGGDQPKVGVPMVSGASVMATVVREMRGDKIIVFKKKRRKNHTKRKHGHRQDLVQLRIDTSISKETSHGS